MLKEDLTETKAEKRERERRNARKMKVHNRSALGSWRIIQDRANELNRKASA